MQEKQVLQIAAFGRTINKTESDKVNAKNVQSLRDKAASLRRLGFHSEAKDYEQRANRLERAVHRREFNAKFHGLRGDLPAHKKLVSAGIAAIKDKIASVPHIKSVIKKEDNKTHKLIPSGPTDLSTMLPKSMRDKLANDRDAAWHFYKTGGVA